MTPRNNPWRWVACIGGGLSLCVYISTRSTPLLVCGLLLEACWVGLVVIDFLLDRNDAKGGES